MKQRNSQKGYSGHFRPTNAQEVAAGLDQDLLIFTEEEKDAAKKRDQKDFQAAQRDLKTDMKQSEADAPIPYALREQLVVEAGGQVRAPVLVEPMQARAEFIRAAAIAMAAHGMPTVKVWRCATELWNSMPTEFKP